MSYIPPMSGIQDARPSTNRSTTGTGVCRSTCSQRSAPLPDQVLPRRKIPSSLKKVQSKLDTGRSAGGGQGPSGAVTRATAQGPSGAVSQGRAQPRPTLAGQLPTARQLTYAKSTVTSHRTSTSKIQGPSGAASQCRAQGPSGAASQGRAQGPSGAVTQGRAQGPSGAASQGRAQPRPALAGQLPTARQLTYAKSTVTSHRTSTSKIQPLRTGGTGKTLATKPLQMTNVGVNEVSMITDLSNVKGKGKKPYHQEYTIGAGNVITYVPNVKGNEESSRTTTSEYDEIGSENASIGATNGAFKPLLTIGMSLDSKQTVGISQKDDNCVLKVSPKKKSHRMESQNMNFDIDSDSEYEDMPQHDPAAKFQPMDLRLLDNRPERASAAPATRARQHHMEQTQVRPATRECRRRVNPILDQSTQPFVPEGQLIDLEDRRWEHYASEYEGMQIEEEDYERMRRESEAKARTREQERRGASVNPSSGQGRLICGTQNSNTPYTSRRM